jgi:hypothetical protein
VHPTARVRRAQRRPTREARPVSARPEPGLERLPRSLAQQRSNPALRCAGAEISGHVPPMPAATLNQSPTRSRARCEYRRWSACLRKKVALQRHRCRIFLAGGRASISERRRAAAIVKRVALFFSRAAVPNHQGHDGRVPKPSCEARNDVRCK